MVRVENLYSNWNYDVVYVLALPPTAGSRKWAYLNMNAALIVWKVVKLYGTCLDSTLSPGEQDGYKSTMSGDMIKKN